MDIDDRCELCERKVGRIQYICPTCADKAARFDLTETNLIIVALAVRRLDGYVRESTAKGRIDQHTAEYILDRLRSWMDEECRDVLAAWDRRHARRETPQEQAHPQPASQPGAGLPAYDDVLARLAEVTTERDALKAELVGFRQKVLDDCARTVAEARKAG